MQPNNSAGFILIYVAAMLVVIAIILFQLGRMQAPSPLFIERQIAQAMQRREEQLLLDFVTDGVRARNLDADPRYLEFKQVVASNARMPSDVQDQVAWLRAALAQLKFNVNVNPGKDATVSVGKTQERMSHEGRGILFQPQKDPYKLKIGEIEYAVKISPANALPSLNSIPYAALWRYLAYLKIPESEAKDLAAALVDWRDEDDLSTDARGAESNYYRGLSPSYPARNAPIRTWQELNYVRGMSPEKVMLLRGNFMLGLPGTFGVSPDFASWEAFVALTALKPETIRAILKEYGKLKDDKPLDRSILLSADATAFDRVVAWKMDTSSLRIQITSRESVLTAEYDSARKRITAWW